MAELLASGFGIGVFAVGCRSCIDRGIWHGLREGSAFYAVAFVLASCVMTGMAMLDPLAFTQWHVDGLAVMTMCG